MRTTGTASSSTAGFAARLNRWLDDVIGTRNADAHLAARIRAQQLRSVLRFAPLTLTANLFNALLIVVVFWGSEPPWVLLLWLAALTVAMRSTLRAWRRDQASPPVRASERAIRRAALHAGVLALLWSVPSLLFFTRAEADSALLVTLISGGMMCAGSFVLANIPRAAVLYVLLLCASSSLAFVIDHPVRNLDLVVLMNFYAALALACAIASARTFGARLLAEAEAERQKQLVGLLLHDFEAHSSDWLWDTDRNGCLQHVSARLAETFGRSLDELRAQPFIELFAQGGRDMNEAEREALNTLAAHLMQPVPFRDVQVALVVEGERRWWALTAKPLFDEGGHHAGWRGVCSDITDSRRAALEMSTLANFDSLTGLANRHHFRNQLAAIRPAGSDEARPCALYFFDLDDFKNVNDSLGHAAGDRVLQLVSQRLQERIRAGDVLSRLGGDEFALICWGCRTPEGAAELAQRLLDTFASPVLIDGVSVQIGSSIGIALAPQHGSDPDALLKNADMALYAAKAAGRNTWRFFEQDMDERARRRLSMHSDLLGALDRDEFELHYQPQIHMRSGRVAGFEALIRWRHPQRGLVSPGEFIPLAEETGLIVPIGRWALEQACLAAARWPDDMHVAVNVSAVQFARGAVVDVVRDALAHSGLAPDRLEIEVTESLLIHDSAAARDTLSTLRALGIGIALDDFGTGYSSLAYLRSFPMTKLKIDRSFVTSLNSEEGGGAIVRAIINLADALRLDTTAEGVETAAEWAALAGKECTYAQGYLMSRPLPEPQIAAFIDGWRGLDAVQGEESRPLRAVG